MGRKRGRRRKRVRRTSGEGSNGVEAENASDSPHKHALPPRAKTSWVGRSLIIVAGALSAIPLAWVIKQAPGKELFDELERSLEEVLAFVQTNVPEVKELNMSTDALLQHFRTTVAEQWGFNFTREEFVHVLRSAIPEVLALNITWQYPHWNSEEIVSTLRNMIPDGLSSNVSSLQWGEEGYEETPGKVAQELGMKAKHPIVIVPGWSTTGLELWQGEPCAQRFFRQRMWGTTLMFQSFVQNRECWLEHITLDQRTGTDPPGIKLRPSQGLEAVDFFVPGYVLWAKIIESLADIGYDSNNLKSAPYDWRLGPDMLEIRDGYFSHLKSMIETLVGLHGEKVAVLSHSYGDRVFRHFMGWIESSSGAGLDGWVSKHVAHYVNIAGPTLGAPKTITGLLSGESRDTAHMGQVQYNLANSLLFGARRRVEIFRSFGSMLAMLPVGGNTIWGDSNFAPEDGDGGESAYGSLLRVEDSERFFRNLSMDESIRLLEQRLLAGLGNDTQSHQYKDFKRYTGYSVHRKQPEHLVHESLKAYTSGLSATAAASPHRLRFSQERSRLRMASDEALEEPPDWGDPLDNPLPNAPELNIFCFYGVGKQTERSYVLTQDGKSEFGDAGAGVRINTSATDLSRNLKNGVYLTDGDGSIPVTSLGAMCAHGWQQERFNPSHMRVVTREYRHDALPLTKAMQGGPRTADHVDILGNHELALDILTIASGNAGNVSQRIHSDVLRIASRIPALNTP